MKMNETTLIYSQPAETLPPIYYMSFDDEDRDVGSLHVEQRKTFGRPSNATLHYRTKEPLFSPSGET